MASMDSFVNEPLTGVVIGSLAFGAALFWFRNGSSSSSSSSSSGGGLKIISSTMRGTTLGEEEEEDDDPNDDGNSNQHQPSKKLLRNVFSAKQKPIEVMYDGNNKSPTSVRPFESSYYFAHNRQSTGGGYKDGLRAEDYVMNGPRLLSRGGVRVMNDDNNGDNDMISPVEEEIVRLESSLTQSPKEATVASSSVMKDTTPTKQQREALTASSIPITRYMWDDDGDDIVMIHIDILPIGSNKTLSWEDANVSREDVEVRLVGNDGVGLYVGIVAEKRRYHLHIPRMYGTAESVRFIIKKRKLLIKITKKRVVRNQRQRLGIAEDNSGVWDYVTRTLGSLIGSNSGGNANNDNNLTLVQWPRLSAVGVASEVIDDVVQKVDLDQW